MTIGAAALLCLVVAVTDGDTLKVRCAEEPQVIIRLAEIDAPESRQAFGQRSKQALASLCFHEHAIVRPATIDRYGRTVAHVECRTLDASTEQVRTGMAWVFVRYSRRPALLAIEAEARAKRRGLWTDEAPVPPWEWRRSSGKKAAP